MSFKWLRPFGKWVLRAIVRELVDEAKADETRGARKRD